MRKKTKQENKVIVIGGPTASGKSDLAVKLALWIIKNKKELGVSGAEIVSADSRQVYKGLNIGSGKITKKGMRGVKHRMLDVSSPKRTFTAHDYGTIAGRTLKDIFKRNMVPIVCGGTGFYIDSLIYSPFIPNVPPQKKLRGKLEKLDTGELFLRLEKIDKKRAESIDAKNRRRLIRAIEIAETLGRPAPEIKKIPLYETLMVGVKLDGEKLKSKIHKRLIKRIKDGMIEEVYGLHYKNGVSWKRLGEMGLEYRWTSRYLRDQISLTEMKIGLERDIVHYAKRQMTWFRKEKGIVWISNFTEARKAVAEFF